jgi:Rrf2 family protein
MKVGEGVEWALHCCAVLAAVPEGSAVAAGRLAEFHGVPPAYLAKHLQALAGAGIAATVPGRRGGYRLGRPASAITLLDIVLAVEGDAPSFRCTEIRRRGPAAGPAAQYRLPCRITVAMRAAEEAWRAELRSHTLAELVATVLRDAHPQVLARTASWLQEVMA